MTKREARRAVRGLVAAWLRGVGDEPPFHDPPLPREVEAVWADEVQRIAQRLQPRRRAQ